MRFELEHVCELCGSTLTLEDNDEHGPHGPDSLGYQCFLASQLENVMSEWRAKHYARADHQPKPKPKRGAK